jgi:hypothetical protein
MKDQISAIAKSAHFALHKISQICVYLDQKATERLVHAFVSSRLDYCNSLLCGLPARDIAKLQRVQNSAARLVAHTKYRDHISPVLRSLHWLPVEKRIDFKMLILTHKALSGNSPVYLINQIEPHKPVRSLRSSTLHLITVPQYRTVSYGNRTFPYSAARLWNNLPPNIREIASFDLFKSSVKTFLFKHAF